jgi:hypothetical protein
MKFPPAKTQIGWHLLGNIGDKYKPYLLPGTTKTMKIYSTRFKEGKTSEVNLFDPTMTSEEIREFLIFK